MSKVAVVTGSTKGLGRGLAEGLLARGYRVAITSPNGADSAAVAQDLGEGAVGFGCDVAEIAQVRALWSDAVDCFGGVDLWINNAGLALTGAALTELPSDDFRRMLDINVLGTMHGCQVAVNGMRTAGGAVYNVFGAGSDGRPIDHMIGYSTTKRAVQFLTQSLVEEVRALPVLVGAISPGLVMTDGFLREHARLPHGPERAARERWVNVIGDHVETLADWACDIFETNREHGAVFEWLSAEKIAARQKDEPQRDILSRYFKG
jgi:NAD(P)-dependent dehydrogenase (short-subunit alcohol dehydrogenase family)